MEVKENPNIFTRRLNRKRGGRNIDNRVIKNVFKWQKPRHLKRNIYDNISAIEEVSVEESKSKGQIQQSIEIVSLQLTQDEIMMMSFESSSQDIKKLDTRKKVMISTMYPEESDIEVEVPEEVYEKDIDMGELADETVSHNS